MGILLRTITVGLVLVVPGAAAVSGCSECIVYRDDSVRFRSKLPLVTERINACYQRILSLCPESVTPVPAEITCSPGDPEKCAANCQYQVMNPLCDEPLGPGDPSPVPPECRLGDGGNDFKWEEEHLEGRLSRTKDGECIFSDAWQKSWQVDEGTPFVGSDGNTYQWKRTVKGDWFYSDWSLSGTAYVRAEVNSVTGKPQLFWGGRSCARTPECVRGENHAPPILRKCIAEAFDLDDIRLPPTEDPGQMILGWEFSRANGVQPIAPPQRANDEQASRKDLLYTR